MITSPLRPIGQLFGDSWALYTQSFVACAKIVLVVLVPLVLLLALPVLPDLSKLLLGMLILVLYYLGCLGLMYAIADRGTSPIASYFRRGLHVAVSYFLTELLVGIIVIFGIILLVIPGIIWAVSYSLVCFVVLFEGISGMAALKQSKTYIKGNWLAVFGRYVMLMIPVIIFSIVLSTLGQDFSQIVGLFTVTPFSLAYVYLIYQDLKTGKSVQVPPQEQIAHPVTE